MNHSRYVKGSLLISVLLLPLVLSGQVKEKVTPTLDFTYLKRTDGSKLLQAKLYLFQNRKTYYITDHLVSFFAGTDSITTVQTNSEGDAFLLIQPGAKIPFNKDGTFTFRAAFAGSDTLDAVSTNLSYKDVNLSMHLVLVDSVRTVKVNLSALDARGDSVPVTGVKVGIYVHRMLSLQKIGEDQTDAQGGMSLEFPRDLPGEADGSITVEARVEDNDTYGNVEVTQVKDWGIPVDHSVVMTHRALWTQIAPWWMIITLTILLLGVWGHYIYVIFQMVLIKKESKNAQARKFGI